MKIKFRKTIFNKLLLTGIILLILPSIMIGMQSYKTAKTELNEKGKVILKNSVQQAISIISFKANGVKSGRMSIEKAQEEIKQYLIGKKQEDGTRSIDCKIDLGENGYIYILDKNGNLLAHPSSEGENLWDSKDKSGKEILFIQDQISTALNGGGFTEYTWTLPNSNQVGPKITYVAYHEDWEWIIAAGSYMQDFNAGSNKVLYALLATLIVSFVIGFIVIFLFAKHIANPVKQIRHGLEKVADGDLTVDSIHVKNKDETGDLAQSFNKMLNNLKGLISTVNESSSTVYKASTSLSEISTQTARATDEVALTISEIANSSSEQAQDVSNGLTQINELGEEIEQVANASSEMDNVSNRTNELTGQGLDAVEILSKKSQENSLAASKANEVVLKVNDSTKQIGVITETISQIAEQTNLLALNASIEAARAGEAGNGFAVVADEIRKLSEQSAQAIQGINDIVQEIQNNSQIAVDSIIETKNIAQEQDKAVEDTKNIFNDISGSIGNLIKKASEVTESSIAMNEKKEKMIAMIENLSAISQQTAASTQQVSAATEEQTASIQEVAGFAEELNRLSNELMDIVNRFKID